MSVWLDNPESWPRLAEALEKAGEFGIDTETYGQPDKTSPQHRARVHCWSVGLLTARQSPRGYRVGAGRVLPISALRDHALRAVLSNPRVLKWAHNAPHDYHSLKNEGVEITGMEDTLQWLRLAVPGMRDYGLKAAEQWALGKPPRPDFLDIVTHPVEVVRTTVRHEKRNKCACGKQPCRSRRDSEWWDPDYVVDGVVGWFRKHEREVEVVAIPTEHRRLTDARWAVTDFVPGHERWDQWLAYSLADAVSAIELVDWLRTRRYQTRRYPWIRPVSQ